MHVDLLIRISVGTPPNLEFKLQIWSLHGKDAPTVKEEILIHTNVVETKWDTYNQKAKETSSKCFVPEALSLDRNLDTLRIGRQLFRRRPGMTYETIVNSTPSDQISMYLEESTSRGPYLVIASRQAEPQIESRQPVDGAQKDPSQDNEDCTSDAKQDSDSEFFAQYPVNIKKMDSSPPHHEVEAGTDASSDESVSSHDSQISAGTESSSLASSDDTSESDFARESWSEGSTEESSEYGHVSVRSCDKSDVSDLSSSNRSGTSHDEVVLNYAQLLNDYDEAQIAIAFESESNSCDNGDDFREYYHAQIQRSSRKPRRKPGSLYGAISVYDMRSGTMTRVFHFEQDLPFRLYSSPPIIHLCQPLAVWPLAAGKILFADFQNNSYFIRSTLPSTRRTRHVFVECHFSICGQYLHIASLEAKLDSTKKRADTAAGGGESRSFNLAVFVSTHRLSKGKPCKSPPRLIHRVKISLGKYVLFSLKRPPVTLTWAEKDLYVTCSSNRLTVYRVAFFSKQEGGSERSALVPRQPTFLPDSARARQVRYLPPKTPGDRAVVIIGSYCELSNLSRQVRLVPTEAPHSSWEMHIPPYESPPIGFFLHESDFGGWGLSMAEVDVTNMYRNGELNRMIEDFDPEDDCDIEHYLDDVDWQSYV
ncbi:MAG: hypothetical protein M1820_000922 [Bogoriella megaspora]|nr:MAG: hypothetical protein M1820_000922 [Bogoriella megaspora]